MCISHKIGDGCNALNLFHDWANITRDPNMPLPSLHYVHQSIYPPTAIINGRRLLPPQFMTLDMHDCVQRKFSFSATKLQALKALVAAESEVQNPTCTEVVTALLFKCTVAKSGSFLLSILTIVTDVRGMVSMSPNSVGNLLTLALLSILQEENLTLPNIVSAMREGKEQTRNRDNIKDNQFVEILHYLASQEELHDEEQHNMYQFSSIVKFPVHEIDFGWGKPVKVSIANGQHEDKCFVLVGNQNGGVDAIVMWNERDLSIFERNAELLEFASPIPTY